MDQTASWKENPGSQSLTQATQFAGYSQGAARAAGVTSSPSPARKWRRPPTTASCLWGSAHGTPATSSCPTATWRKPSISITSTTFTSGWKALPSRKSPWNNDLSQLQHLLNSSHKILMRSRKFNEGTLAGANMGPWADCSSPHKHSSFI